MCKLPGETSIGFIWPVEEVDLDSDDELEDPYEHPDNKRLLELGTSQTPGQMLVSSANDLFAINVRPIS
jgi:translation initiation factor eIF-2B subunit epsilon